MNKIGRVTNPPLRNHRTPSVVRFNLPALLGFVVKNAPRLATHLGREAAAHGVFGDAARVGEVPQVAGAAGLGADAAHVEAAEGLPPDDRAGAAPVEVEVADPRAPGRPS